jgi:hypothetical protein
MFSRTQAHPLSSTRARLGDYVTQETYEGSEDNKDEMTNSQICKKKRAAGTRPEPLKFWNLGL